MSDVMDAAGSHLMFFVKLRQFMVQSPAYAGHSTGEQSTATRCHFHTHTANASDLVIQTGSAQTLGKIAI
jgi:hypothetical protein